MFLCRVRVGLVILVTGPESCGTRLLARLVATSGLEVMHRSIPHGDDWVIPNAEVTLGITRNPMFACMSAVVAGHTDTLEEAQHRHRRALRIMSRVEFGYTVQYERLVEDPDPVSNLEHWLGRYGGGPLTPEPFTNANTKYTTMLKERR